jgi:hypothetical protein
LLRRNQKIGYNILFRASAAALQDLAWDPHYVGGQIGMVSVLHTWGRNLSYHPHVHYLVPAGGLAADRESWINTRHDFLVPVKALSIIFRAKFRDTLKKTDLFEQVSPEIWRCDWVVHCKSVGSGLPALKYLAPYIFRVAISNNRIIKVADGKVTFRYRESDTRKWRTSTLTAEEFLRRFLQHVLPKGFVKVRYYGLFSPGLRHYLAVIRLWLDASEPEETKKDDSAEIELQHQVLCPTCGQVMQWVNKLRPRSRCPP